MPLEDTFRLKITTYTKTSSGIFVLVLMNNLVESWFSLDVIASMDASLVNEFLKKNPGVHEYHMKHRPKS